MMMVREEEEAVAEEEGEEVEEKVVVEEEWKEVWEEAEVERENMRGSLEMLELVSKLKTSVVVVERATGELLRMILRKEMKLLTIHLWRKRQLMEKLLPREKLRRMPLLKTRSLSKRK